MVNNFDDIIRHSMAFIEDDYTELWVIATKVQEENPRMNFNELIEATKEVTRELVENRNVFILNEQTQEPNKLSIDEILSMVEDKFRILGRVPNIGDGIWFTI